MLVDRLAVDLLDRRQALGDAPAVKLWLSCMSQPPHPDMKPRPADGGLPPQPDPDAGVPLPEADSGEAMDDDPTQRTGCAVGTGQAAGRSLAVVLVLMLVLVRRWWS